MKVTIIMLTYNAPRYVEHSIRTIKDGTKGINYELLVYDNNSNEKTVKLLKDLKRRGYIDKLVFSDKNYYFVGGNNRAVRWVSEDTDLILLINSDIEIRNSQWLLKMVDIHKKGITACQVCSKIDNRPDGWCLLVDKDIYLEHMLDENRFTWYYSIADFGSRIMKSGYSVQTIECYQNFIRHFGGMSEIAKDILQDAHTLGDDIDKWYPHPCYLIKELAVDKKNKLNTGVNFVIYNFAYKIIRKLKNIINSLTCE